MLLLNNCNNMTEGNKYISNLLKTYNIDEIIKNKEILTLLKYHPNKKIDIDNIEYIKLKLRPPYYKPSLFFKYKNGVEDDLSWRLCVRNYFGKYNKSTEKLRYVHTAFRTISHFGSKQKFRLLNNENICCNCDNITNIQTDHYPIPYKKIFNDFIEQENINLSNIDIYEDENNCIKIRDKILSKKWLDYHDSIATYRLLCNSCNSSNGAYGF